MNRSFPRSGVAATVAVAVILLVAVGCGIVPTGETVQTSVPTEETEILVTVVMVETSEWIFGWAYLDANQNGGFDADDPPLQGAVFVIVWEDGTEATRITGADGRASYAYALSGKMQDDGIRIDWEYPNLQTRMEPPQGFILVKQDGARYLFAPEPEVTVAASSKERTSTPTPPPTNTSAPTNTATATPTPISTPAPPATEFLCTDALGCVHILPGELLRIGTMMVVSGPNAALGVDTRRGVEIAIDDQQEVLGHRIELVGEDSLCTAEGGQTAATKLSVDPKLMAVIGTNCSSEARAALPIMCSAGIPLVSPSNVAPDLTDPNRPADYACYLRTSWSDEIQGTAAAHFAWEELGVKRAATIHDGSFWADRLQQTFAEEFEALGGTVTAQEAFDSSGADATAALTHIGATEPELLYYPVMVQAGGLITQQARQIPSLELVTLLSADATFSPDFLATAGDAALGLYWTSPDFSSFGPEYDEFVHRYRAKYGEGPLAPFHAHAYDAAMMIFAAIEKAAVQDADDTLHIGRQALRDALYATAEFKGLTGTLTCDEHGDCAVPRIAVYECVDTDPANWNPGTDKDSNPKKVWP